jgi:hypothetical protein
MKALQWIVLVLGMGLLACLLVAEWLERHRKRLGAMVNRIRELEDRIRALEDRIRQWENHMPQVDRPRGGPCAPWVVHSLVSEMRMNNEAIPGIANVIAGLGQTLPPWQGLSLQIADHLRASVHAEGDLLRALLMERELPFADTERLRLIGWLHENSSIRWAYALAVMRAWET